MNRFLVLTVALVCVNARPDIGLKLREAASPTGSYLPGVGVQQESFQAAPVGHLPTYNTYNPVVSHIIENKNFFFDAPEDLGATHVRVHVQPSAAAGEKSIFIRAPAYSSKIVPHFNIQQQQQEAGKTKVFVLVKKPEEQQDIVVPAAVQAPAAKPEVVFIKYKTQKEAEEKIKSIQEGSAGGDSAKNVFNHRELVSSIKDEPVHQHHHQLPTISYTAGPIVQQPIIEQSAGAPALAGIQSFGPIGSSSVVGTPSVSTGPSSFVGTPSVSAGPSFVGTPSGPSSFISGGSTHSSVVGGAPGAPRLIIDTIIGTPNQHSVAGITTTVTQTGKGKGISRTQDIVIPVAPHSPTESPEVFFVKYTDQKDVADKIHSIESGNTETLLKGNPLPHHEDLANAIPESSSVSESTSSSSSSVITKEETHEFGPAGESGPY